MDRKAYLKHKQEWEKRYNEIIPYYLEELQETFRNFRGNQYRLYKCENKLQKMDILATMQAELEYIERKIKEIEIEIGPMTRNKIESMFDYDIALMRTYATGCVYDEDNNNIFD